MLTIEGFYNPVQRLDISKSIDECQHWRVSFQQMITEIDNVFGEEPQTPTDTPPRKRREAKPGFDFDAALKLLAGRRSLLIRLLSNFKSDLVRMHDTIHQSLESDDYECAQRTVHTVKGASQQICALALSQASVDLEKAILTRQADMKASMNRFDAAVKTTLNAITTRLDQESSPLPANDEPARTTHPGSLNVQKALRQMITYLERGDMRAVDTWEELKNQIEDTGAGRLLADVEKKMVRLEFNSAAIILRKMMKSQDARHARNDQSE